MLGPDQTILLSFMTVIGEESHEIVNHCYGKKKPIKEHVVGLVKADEKIQTF